MAPNSHTWQLQMMSNNSLITSNIGTILGDMIARLTSLVKGICSLQFWPFISYKYTYNSMNRMYNPIEITINLSTYLIYSTYIGHLYKW